MAQNDLIVLQNVASTGIEYNEKILSPVENGIVGFDSSLNPIVMSSITAMAGTKQLVAGNNMIEFNRVADTNYLPSCTAYNVNYEDVGVQIRWDTLTTQSFTVWVYQDCTCRWSVLKNTLTTNVQSGVNILVQGDNPITFGYDFNSINYTPSGNAYDAVSYEDVGFQIKWDTLASTGFTVWVNQPCIFRWTAIKY